jgi:BirA family transcriptional regulator, biotin operon repressor / biotin---[acetyl-CoA-carboxylase] ligase
MATPYLLIRQEEVTSTQDLARAQLASLPVQVVARRQTAGRGRTGAEWVNAPGALATSIAFLADSEDWRPFSLMAGVAAVRAMPGLGLKWPNDLIESGRKVGGILVERNEDRVVVGLGVNIWWPDPPAGFGALRSDEPPEALHAQIAGIWGAEFLDLVANRDWPLDEYRRTCLTIGRRITWHPDGAGLARDVSEEGALVVESDGTTITLGSGSVDHVRWTGSPSPGFPDRG